MIFILHILIRHIQKLWKKDKEHIHVFYSKVIRGKIILIKVVLGGQIQMKMLKKRTCLLLPVVIVVSGLLTACGNATSVPTDSDSNPVSETIADAVSESNEVQEDIIEVKEYERAVSYGLVPEGWEKDLQKTVSNKEFCELISSLIQITKPEKIDEWNKLAADAMLSDDTMQRFHAAIGLFYAAQVLDCGYVHECESADLPKIQSHPDFWNFVDYSFELWPDFRMIMICFNVHPVNLWDVNFITNPWGMLQTQESGLLFKDIRW